MQRYSRLWFFACVLTFSCTGTEVISKPYVLDASGDGFDSTVPLDTSLDALDGDSKDSADATQSDVSDASEPSSDSSFDATVVDSDGAVNTDSAADSMADTTLDSLPDTIADSTTDSTTDSTFDSLADSLGDSPAEASISPNFIHDLAIGSSHMCAIVGPSREVYCWGSNQQKQSGIQDSVNFPEFATPRKVRLSDGTALVNVRSIHAGISHSCAVNSAGVAYCWGGNRYLQAGSPSDIPDGGTGYPTLFGSPAGGIQLFSSTQNHGCSLAPNSGKSVVACWGQNSSGQLGFGHVSPTTDAGMLTNTVIRSPTLVSIHSGLDPLDVERMPLKSPKSLSTQRFVERAQTASVGALGLRRFVRCA